MPAQNGLDTATGPANGPRQVDIRAQAIGRGLQTLGLFNLNHDRLDRAQRTREPGGQTIR